MTFVTNHSARILLALTLGACGAPAKVDAPPSGAGAAASGGPVAAGSAGSSGAHAQGAGAAGTSSRDAGVPEVALPDHPFASTPAEATSLIDAAIDAKIGPIA